VHERATVSVIWVSWLLEATMGNWVRGSGQGSSMGRVVVACCSGCFACCSSMGSGNVEERGG
jgi:hypothetical protein